MSKKVLIILIIILVIIGGFFVYKKYFKKAPEPAIPKWQKLLVFEIKDSSLAPETAELYKNKFNETKEKLVNKPEDINNWLYLGVLKKMVNDYMGAQDVWLYVTEKWPKDGTAFGNLGDLYANFLKEPQKAETAYKAAILFEPKNVNHYLGLAEVYRYRMPGKEALYEQTLLEGLKTLGDDGNLIGPLASYYRQTNQIDKAIEYYEKLVKIAPDNQAAKDDLAELKKQR